MRRAFSASLRSTTGPFLALGAAAALIGGALVVPPAVATSTVPDPVVHYTFESSDLTTGQVTDVSGNGATGTLVNPSTATIVAGADGSSALHLPGGSPSSNGAYVRLPTSILAGRTDLTVTARVNWDGTGGAWQRIVDLGRTPPATCSSRRPTAPRCGPPSPPPAGAARRRTRGTHRCRPAPGRR